jgi:hypothetical protein
VLAAGCARGAPDATPEGAVRLWLEKMETSTEDPRAMREAFVLLGPAARANLDERAQRASRVQGRRVEAYEMLAEGRFGLKFRPKVMVSHVEGDRATVEVTGDDPVREHARVLCAREPRGQEPGDPGEHDRDRAPAPARGSAWRVEPELPDVMALPRR